MTRSTLDQSLAEQMKLTDREIGYRKRLFGLTDEDETLLLAFKPMIVPQINRIIERHYERQTAMPEIAALIGDRDTLQRLKSAMRGYILDLFEGRYDSEYVNKRLRIGLVHKRIGVSPKLFMSGVNTLHDTLMREIDYYAERDLQYVDETRQALEKLMFFDTHLIFDTYISGLMGEVETARAGLESYATGLEEQVAERTRMLQELSVTDSLTGVHNQRFFYDQLRKELSVAMRGKHTLVLIYLDLNGFKKLNDSAGHAAGDAALASLGKAMRAVSRASDICCRYGGDEFAIIMPRATADDGKVLAARLTTFFHMADPSSVTLSADIVETGPDDFPDAEAMVKQADEAMYRAKARARLDGKDHFVVDIRPGTAAAPDSDGTIDAAALELSDAGAPPEPAADAPENKSAA